MNADMRVTTVQNEVARQAEELTELREQLRKIEDHLDALYHQLGLRRLGRRAKA